MTAGPPASAAGCPSCGAPVAPQDSFCEACGAELAPASVSSGGGAGVQCPSCQSAQISPEGYCDSCGHKVPSGRDHQELDLGLLAGVTDRGLRHRRNEDAMALATAQTSAGPVAVAVVCDGVSTSDRPDEASLVAAQAAVRVLLTAVRAEEDLLDASARAVQAAQQAVADLGGRAGAVPGAGDSPSATFVSAVLTIDAVVLCWLGDSRAYWLDSGGGAQRLTTDDSLAAEMVTAGLLSEADALATPQAHVVTRWLGGDTGESAPHFARFEPPGPGVLLLCSDGLWNYQPEAAALANLALPEAMSSPLSAAARLVTFGLEAGGVDNITAVLAPFPPSGSRPSSAPDPSA